MNYYTYYEEEEEEDIEEEMEESEEEEEESEEAEIEAEAEEDAEEKQRSTLKQVQKTPTTRLREVKIQRVPFGIDKLDEALEGGVPKGSWVVIGGEPGTGKSIMAIAWKGLELGDKVIYVTTEQEFYDIIIQAKQFGMDFDEYNVFNLAEAIQWDRADREWTFEKPSKTPDIVVIDLFGLSRVARFALQEQLSSEKSKTTKTKKTYVPWSIDTLVFALDKAYELLEVEKGQHVRLIIDSMSTFWVDKPAMARRYSYQLKLHRSNITAFLTSQYAMTTRSMFGFGVEHIADVVMETWMSDIKTTKKLERYLAIKKARMTAIRHYLFRIDFKKEGNISKLILEPV